MTGLFSFPTKSIGGIFWASLLVFMIPVLLDSKRIVRFVTIPVAFIMLVLVLLSASRAGWLGCTTGFIFLIDRYLNDAYKRKLLRRFAVPGLVILLLFLFFYKTGSSKGRLLIYSISFTMLSENWQYGTGVGTFKARFNEYQADFFKQHSIDGKEALLADNTFYAFNDYLQWFTETGIGGLLLLVAVLFLLAKRILHHYDSARPRSLLVSAGGSLICISITSLFSYPMQVMPIQLLALMCAGILLFYPFQAGDQRREPSFFRFVIGFSYSILCLYFLIYSCLLLKTKTREKTALELVRAGNRSAAMDEYKTLAASFPVQGYNIYLYAEQLYFLNRIEEAEDVLAEAMTIYVDNKVYKLKATIENELGQYKEAEKNYLRAVYMVPNRMGSRFDLLNFYIARKDSSQAICWAKSILQMPVKVPSAKTENMLQRTRSILEKLQ